MFALGTRAARGLKSLPKIPQIVYPDLMQPASWKPMQVACTVVCRETPDYTRMFGAKFMGRGHPKVSAHMTIKTKDIKLDDLEREVFLKLVGPRLRRNTDTIHITVDNLPTMLGCENRCYQILEKLIDESKALAETIREERATGKVEEEVQTLTEISPTRPLNANEWKVHVDTVKSSPLNF